MSPIAAPASSGRASSARAQAVARRSSSSFACGAPNVAFSVLPLSTVSTCSSAPPKRASVSSAADDDGLEPPRGRGIVLAQVLEAAEQRRHAAVLGQQVGPAGVEPGGDARVHERRQQGARVPWRRVDHAAVHRELVRHGPAGAGAALGARGAAERATEHDVLEPPGGIADDGQRQRAGREPDGQLERAGAVDRGRARSRARAGVTGEDRHDGVADEQRDLAAVPANEVDDRREDLVDRAAEPLGPLGPAASHRLAHRGEAAHVGHHHDP